MAAQHLECFKLLFWVALLFLARLMPHVPNLTPYMSLLLLMGYSLPRRTAIFLTLLSLIAADVILALWHHDPIFGLWSLFTYSGFLSITFVAYGLKQNHTFVRIGTFALSSVLGYWLWTNFGTWLTSGMYAYSWAGFMQCFILALPFLQASLISALIFVPLFFGLMMCMERAWALKLR
jgi:hypothetical protein